MRSRMPQQCGFAIEQAQAVADPRSRPQDSHRVNLSYEWTRALRLRGPQNGRMPNDELTALVRAIAWELVQLGYRPDDRPGYVQQEGRDPVRLVADETWQAMREIVAGARH
jgi:hypothetical protein